MESGSGTSSVKSAPAKSRLCRFCCYCGGEPVSVWVLWRPAPRLLLRPGGHWSLPEVVVNWGPRDGPNGVWVAVKVETAEATGIGRAHTSCSQWHSSHRGGSGAEPRWGVQARRLSTSPSAQTHDRGAGRLPHGGQQRVFSPHLGCSVRCVSRDNSCRPPRTTSRCHGHQHEKREGEMLNSRVVQTFQTLMVRWLL
jgi:hypothetical protein